MTDSRDVVQRDLEEIVSNLGENIFKLEGNRLVITGGAGFLGYYLIQAVLQANDSVFKKPCQVVCVDNLIRGCPDWLVQLEKRSDFTLIRGSATDFVYENLESVQYLIHAASIASPLAYRQRPIETMDANIIGLRRILDYASSQAQQGRFKSLLFFSSSEIYGDPDPAHIPTPETYWGNVSCTGPRACYDESKRFGETLCIAFQKARNVPVKIVRPFNNYGPGLSLDDKRVIPDFCGSVLRGTDIVMHSDGSPTRTFCYVSDAVTGYLLALLSDHNGESFNIGTETPEISMKALGQKVIDTAGSLWGHKGLKVVCEQSTDSEYLTDNPNRRCPTIAKARKFLGYDPKVSLDDGLRRTLTWYKPMTM